MSEREYDSKTQDKLLKIYNDNILNYSKENKKKKDQLNDLKATLNINQNLLYNFIKSSSNIEEKKLTELINKYISLWENLEKLIKLSQETELKTYKLNSFTEKIPIEIKKELNNLAIKNNKAKNDIILKDNQIKKLKQELDKARNSALFKEAKTEIYVTDPTKKNLEKNVEIIDARAIMGKVTRKHSKNKKKANKLKKDYTSLKDELNELKQKIPQYNEDFFNLQGYINIEENFEEIEEEEDEKKESSDDSLEEKSKKRKEKELKELKEKYNKLKKDYEECEKKINEYKKIYNSMQGKIEKIKDGIAK